MKLCHAINWKYLRYIGNEKERSYILYIVCGLRADDSLVCG